MRRPRFDRLAVAGKAVLVAHRFTGDGYGDVRQADRFGLAATVGTRDAGYTDAHVAPARFGHSNRHRPCNGFADRSIALDQLERHV